MCGPGTSGEKQSPEDPAFWETLYARTRTLTGGAEPLGNLSEGCPPAIAGNSLTATVYHNVGAAASYARGP